MQKLLVIAISSCLLFMAQCTNSVAQKDASETASKNAQATPEAPASKPVPGLTGVLVETGGDVSIIKPGGTLITPSIGKELPNGAIVNVGKGGQAGIMLMNGTIIDVPEKTSYVVGVMPKAKEKTTVVQGIAVALNESSNVAIPTAAGGTSRQRNQSPRVQGMVKMGNVGPTAPRTIRVPGGNKAPVRTQPDKRKPDRALTKDEQTKLSQDLRLAEQSATTSDGKAFLKGQVYYKYGQYGEMAATLKPVYLKQKSPAVKRLLKLAYVRMGLYSEARKYQ